MEAFPSIFRNLLPHYALVFPCAVTSAVKLGDRLSFIFSRALMLGKYSLVTSPLVVASHCCRHFSVFFFYSCRSISLFVILLKHISRFFGGFLNEFIC